MVELTDLEGLEDCMAKASEGMQYQEAKLSIFCSNGRLGSDIGSTTHSVGKVISWRDPEQKGYFSRDKEFVVEFQIAGRNFAYGNIQYRFMDGRSTISVQDEVLLERIHDAISTLAGKLRKNDYSI